MIDKHHKNNPLSCEECGSANLSFLSYLETMYVCEDCGYYGSEEDLEVFERFQKPNKTYDDERDQ
jgi:hypothetical protein